MSVLGKGGTGGSGFAGFEGILNRSNKLSGSVLKWNRLMVRRS